MTVSLNRSYSGYPAGAVVALNASTEATLIGSGWAQATAATPTPGNVATNERNGRVVFAAGAASVTVNQPFVNASSKVSARINQATADANMTGVRVVPAPGSFTIYPNAAPGAATVVDWEMSSTGIDPNQ